jgi:anthrone oxygenase-like protein
MTVPILEFLATLAAGIFAGAALYINVAEHPARLLCETRAAALQWAPSYKRATLMQAPLALISLLAGALAWLFGAGALWLAAAISIGLVVPFTLIVIMPTNQRLLEAGRDLASDQTRLLLVRWGTLHAVRTWLSLIAFVLDLWSLAAASQSHR